MTSALAFVNTIIAYRARQLCQHLPPVIVTLIVSGPAVMQMWWAA